MLSSQIKSKEDTMSDERKTLELSEGIYNALMDIREEDEPMDNLVKRLIESVNKVEELESEIEELEEELAEFEDEKDEEL